MNVVELISKIDRLNMKLSTVDGKLIINGDKELLTQELLSQVRLHKYSLINMLSSDVSEPTLGKVKYPLTKAQEEIFAAYLLDKNTLQFNLCSAVLLSGKLNKNAVFKAVELLFTKHESLRAKYLIDESTGEYYQEVAELDSVPVAWFDESSKEFKLERFCFDFANKTFDLKKDPLLRVAVVSLSNDKCLLTMLRHHISTDGWSFAILTKDFCDFYNRVVKGESDSRRFYQNQYVRFVENERTYLKSERFNVHKKFWKRVLGDPLKSNRIPELSHNIRTVGATATTNFELCESTVEKLNLIGGDCNGTLFSVLMTIFNISLLKDYLIRGLDKLKVTVGTDVNLRAGIEHEEVVGLFVNRLPMSFVYNANDSFIESLQNSINTYMKYMEYKQFPSSSMRQLESEFAVDGGQVHISALIGLHNNPHTTFSLDDVSIDKNIFFPPLYSNIPLTLYFTNLDNKLVAEVIYVKENVAEEYIRSLINTILVTIDLICCPNDRTLKNILTEVEGRSQDKRRIRRAKYSDRKRNLREKLRKDS